MAKVTFTSNEKTGPKWLADVLDPNVNMVRAPAKLNAAGFEDYESVLVKLSAAALADATSLAVDALSGAIPSGTMLYCGESKEFALTTAAAAAGAEEITVQALPSALEDNDEAYYRPKAPRKMIPSGTLVGRTVAERAAGTGYGPATVASDDEIYLTIFDVEDAADNADVELLKHGCTVKENYLPNWDNLGSTVQAKIRALYTCITGVN